LIQIIRILEQTVIQMNRLFLLLFGVVTFVAHAQVPDYVPTEGLVAWYPFNGNANDESGNGNDGVLLDESNFVPDNMCSGGDLIIGQEWDGVPYDFIGDLDDFGFWNRALTESEILALYNAQMPAPGCTDSAACNYDAEATSDDGSCTFAAYGQDCDGNCTGGTTWFVDGNTELTDTDGSETQPFSTVQAAIDAACPGDTILIAPGQYTENINLTVANIVLSGYAPELAIEDVAENVILDGNELGTTLFVSGENTVVSHLTIQNGKSGYGAGLYLSGANQSTVHNCIIRDNIGTGDITAHGIALNASNCVIEDCLVTGNYGRKHTVNTGGSDNIIRNCRIVDNNAWETGGGIVVYTNRMLIENCYIAENNGGGITTYKDNTVVDHCTVTGNGGFGFFIWCYSNDADFWITNSISSNNGNQEFTIAQTGNLVGTAHLRNTLIEGGVDYDWQSVYKVFDVDSTLIELPPALLEDGVPFITFTCNWFRVNMEIWIRW
jgi:hypothetical protein